jgi:hypothetical protein
MFDISNELSIDLDRNLAKTLQIKTLWKRKKPPLMVGFTNV